VAVGSPRSHGVIEPVGEPGSPAAVPSNPNSRPPDASAPQAKPVEARMGSDGVVVGIDVAKAGLDVHLLAAGEAFAVARDAAGIDALIERLRPLAPAIVAVAATGGLESVVGAGLGAPACRSWWSIRRRFRPSPIRWAGGRRRIRSMRPSVRGGDRRVRRGDQAGDPAPGRRRDHGAGRPDRPAAANHPDAKPSKRVGPRGSARSGRPNG
jgi:hypothetical protein